MGRQRTLRVLFARPSDGQRVAPLFAFPAVPDTADLLPVALLRLATAVKLGSPHRAFVHDARRERAGNRSIRAAAGVNRADVAVIELDLALLMDGLEAARAAREGGCSLVLATGPLVARWPGSVAGMPEFDGLLDPGGAPALLALLAAASDDSLSAVALAETLAMAPGPPPVQARGADRRLLDYAAYRGCHPGRAPNPGQRVDKGRWAATPLLLDDEAGRLREASDVQGELDECELLGVRHVALRCGDERPTLPWLLDALPEREGARVIAPMPERPDGLERLASRGVVALDLGDLPVGDPAALERAERQVRLAEEAGFDVLARACFGLAEREAEERGLERLRGLDLPVTISLVCPVPPEGSEAARTWRAWLDAPRPGFRPPVRGGDRTVELAERARVLLARGERRGVRAALGRVARWARGAAV